MTYSEESYVLDTLKELQEVIKSPDFRQLMMNVVANLVSNNINIE